MTDRVELSIVLESKEKGTQSSEFNNQSKETKQDEQDKEQEKQKNRFFQILEKNHDHLEAMGALVTIISFCFTVFALGMQFSRSVQASIFYGIEENYFFQESVVSILFHSAMNILLILGGIFFPIVSHYINRWYKDFAKVDSKEKGLQVLHNYFFPLIIFFFLFLIYLVLVPICLSPSVKNLLVSKNEVLNEILWIVSIVLSYVFIVGYFCTSASDVYDFFILVTTGIILCIIYHSFKNMDNKKIYMAYFVFSVYYLVSHWGFNNINNCLFTIFSIFFSIIILLLLFMPLIEFIESFGNNAYSKIKEYEIVQLISASNLERVKEKTKSDSINQTVQGDAEYNRLNEQNKDESPFQVVILHRGSQVLLMNGKIDGKETINPQEDITSSSNLEIDTSSYEFQEASQYRFYRKKFNNVTTNPPPNND